jgi:hypothetical protein
MTGSRSSASCKLIFSIPGDLVAFFTHFSMLLRIALAKYALG